MQQDLELQQDGGWGGELRESFAAQSLGGEASTEKIEGKFLASTQFPPHPEAQAGIPGCGFKA